MKETTFGFRKMVLVAVASVALAAPAVQAQTLTPSVGDLILGFYADGSPGQTLNLEVDLGAMSNFYNATGSFALPALALQDLVNTYGSTWYTRTDLFWGAVSTTGLAAGTPDGHAPIATLWATAPDGQGAFNRESKFAQEGPISTINEMVDSGSPGTLYGATPTTNSSMAAVINNTQSGSWSAQDLKTPGTSFGYFNPTVDNAAFILSGNQVVSDLYEMIPTNTAGVAGTLLGYLVLTRNGLNFQPAGVVTPPVAGFSASPVSGSAPLQVTFSDDSTGTISNWFWSFGDGTSTNTAGGNVMKTYSVADIYTVQLIVSGSQGSSTNTQVNVISVSQTFASWQLQYFGCTNCAEAAPSADPYGKGLSNSEQFLLGLNPTNPASMFRIISEVTSSGNNVITWKTAGPRTNVLQVVNGGTGGGYSSNNFQDISGEIIINAIGDTTTNYTDVGGATNRPARYYRVRLGP